MKKSAKLRILEALKRNSASNTFSVAQARARFGIQNVAARISELRQEGYAIYTNLRTRKDGTKVAVYRLGTPSAAFKLACKQRGVKVQNV